MVNCGMQVETLDAAVVNYINEIKTQYEQRIQELQQKFESSIKEIKEYQYKYLEIKEHRAKARTICCCTSGLAGVPNR
jgi:uncharacterized membrane-anchored protein YhcB (DUF1043 family)